MKSLGTGTDRRRALALVALLVVTTLGIAAAQRHAGAVSGGGGAAAGGGAALPAHFEARGAGGARLAAQLDRTAVLAGADPLVRVELSMQAEPAPGVARRLPADVVVVLDRSGSMSGEKMTFARAALRALVEQLGDADRVALVTYSDGAEIALPLAGVTGPARRAWLAAVESVAPNGGTNLAAGLDLGLAVLHSARASGRAPRILLVSDGLANQGDSSPQGLRARASRAAAAEAALSTIGVGLDFDEALMSSLADAGTGNFYFLESAAALEHIFSAEFSLARATAASGVEIALAPPPGVEIVSAAGYPLERSSDGVVRLRPGALFAGQERRIWVTYRVPTAPAGAVHGLGPISLSYTREGRKESIALDGAPRVAVEDDPARQLAAVDAGAWARAVEVEEVNALKRDAAAAIREGRQDEMSHRIASYREKLAKENARVQSPEVAQQLNALGAVLKDVQASASAPAAEQSRAAKKYEADAKAAARPGSTAPVGK